MLQFVRPLVRASAAAAVTAAITVSAAAQTTTGARPDVHYVPTPEPVVERMLELADPKPGELLMDLGSGDGRIPITAVKKYGVRAIGIDIDPVRISEAKANAREAGVEDKVEFRQENLFEADIAKADIVTLYLLESLNLRLRPRLLAELKPGTRIVSHSFSMGDWAPDRRETVDGRQVYFWTVPEKRAQQ
ncbi:methyltransferase domain-containing protein [Rhodoplanes sp. TEM]|uniref:Methyltransferase domain-containing protein n=1 Tax=Rhodoplanes tepidamans TaxID=200616 RepID=A0ABT5JIG6_RHOTP|nr:MULTISPECIES: methyltransferase domain-containing protein [Rhodoplanes]MDC7789493.1 methyltransferase domain-containing protein [Rhodoplanes tepidamans]MDC7986123.1 methyltransferase domain-containing protein [Rhodoplanes sp. TEM]MDQ0358910.1 cyclopropane fatty-acyl-phospholipid synthase-like methyltransferase [Rhodoplanes tepidamans]